VEPKQRLMRPPHRQDHGQSPVARSKLPGRVFSRLVNGCARFSQAWH
jgi:hypothetical protein